MKDNTQKVARSFCTFKVSAHFSFPLPAVSSQKAGNCPQICHSFSDKTTRKLVSENGTKVSKLFQSIPQKRSPLFWGIKQPNSRFSLLVFFTPPYEQPVSHLGGCGFAKCWLKTDVENRSTHASPTLSYSKLDGKLLGISVLAYVEIQLRWSAPRARIALRCI